MNFFKTALISTIIALLFGVYSPVLAANDAVIVNQIVNNGTTTEEESTVTVTFCHVLSPVETLTLTVAQSVIDEHFAHGDFTGECPLGGGGGGAGAGAGSGASSVLLAPTIEVTEEVEEEEEEPEITIGNVIVNASQNEASISWETSLSGLSVLSWGTTPDYGGGAVSEATFSTSHTTVISNLVADTTYYLKIEAQDIFNNIVSHTQTFQTLIAEDVEAPANVSNLISELLRSGALRLAWINSTDDDFDVVRVLRSEESYLDNPFAGRIVYEGSGDNIVDDETEEGSTYYYTVFSRDETGNYSSGSIVLGQTQPSVVVPTEIQETLDIVLEEEINLQQLVDEGVLTAEDVVALENLFEDDFVFTQADETVRERDILFREQINVQADEPLTISFDRAEIPEVVETIIFSFKDADGVRQSQSFFLDVTQGEGVYETSIAPLTEEGLYEFEIAFFAEDNQIVKTIEGDFALQVEQVSLVEQFTEVTQQFTQPVVNTVTNTVETVVDTVTDTVTAIVDTVTALVERIASFWRGIFGL